MKRGKNASYKLHSVYFSQTTPSRNELFRRLSFEARKRFGQRVLALGLGEELALEWQPPHERPIPDLDRWREFAQCKDDYELFLSSNFQYQEKAKRICELCVVRPPCLMEAIANQEPTGVWGGLSVRERHAMKAHDLNSN